MLFCSPIASLFVDQGFVNFLGW